MCSTHRSPEHGESRKLRIYNMKTTCMSEKRFFFGVCILLLFAITFSSVYAQSAPRNGSQLGAQNEQAMDGTDDGMQRGNGMQENTSTGGSDATGGDQDRNRIQDPAMSDGDQDAVQDRTRTQEQTNLSGDAQQQRLRTPAELEQYIQEQSRVRAQSTEPENTQMRSRSSAQVASDAFVAAEPFLGKEGSRVREIAQEMNQAAQVLEKNESVLQNRSRTQLFLFGQDSAAVATMQQEMERNQDRIQDLTQYMRDCEDCDQAATQMLVTQIQNMEREQDRLTQVVDDASGRRGVLGFLFGWMR